MNGRVSSTDPLGLVSRSIMLGYARVTKIWYLAVQYLDCKEDVSVPLDQEVYLFRLKSQYNADSRFYSSIFQRLALSPFLVSIPHLQMTPYVYWSLSIIRSVPQGPPRKEDC